MSHINIANYSPFENSGWAHAREGPNLKTRQRLQVGSEWGLVDRSGVLLARPLARSILDG